MAISTVHFLLAFLLAVPPVMARPGTWLKTATLSSHGEDPCNVHAVACNPTAFGARAVILVASMVSIIVMAPSIMRVCTLKKTSRTEDDTLFWWSLCFGSGGYFTWVYYFWDCQDLSFTSFPIFVACLFLSFIHVCLLIYATVATAGKCDWRLAVIIVGPAGLWAISYGISLWSPIIGVGWWGFAVISLSHSFRVASINYRDNPAGEVRLCGLSMSHKQFFGWVSFLGAVSGLLWLINPQLCFSLQYKVTSYAIALVRAWETGLWVSRFVARKLSKIEGQPEE